MTEINVIKHFTRSTRWAVTTLDAAADKGDATEPAFDAALHGSTCRDGLSASGVSGWASALTSEANIPGPVTLSARLRHNDPGNEPAEAEEGGDTRFRDLLGPDAWRWLPAVVRHRFSVAAPHGASRVFIGEVTEMRLTRAGRILAQLARLAGGPLPTMDGATGPATVVVTEDHALGGQIWTRTYARPGRFPQTINSVKRFGGPTGLEEYLGLGLVMRLALGVEDSDLVFRSIGYDLTLFGMRLALPRWLSPGVCTIRHRALGPERFAFTLALDHPRFGRMASQVCVFKEVRP